MQGGTESQKYGSATDFDIALLSNIRKIPSTLPYGFVTGG